MIRGRNANGNTLSTAELFDPVSGSFTPTGSINTPRESQTATLLSDGKVLITGGDNGTESLATVELFDQTGGSSAPTGGMNTGRDLPLEPSSQTEGYLQFLIGSKSPKIIVSRPSAN